MNALVREGIFLAAAEAPTLAQSTPESVERRAALASLENIQAELGVRLDGL